MPLSNQIRYQTNSLDNMIKETVLSITAIMNSTFDDL